MFLLKICVCTGICSSTIFKDLQNVCCQLNDLVTIVRVLKCQKLFECTISFVRCFIAFHCEHRMKFKSTIHISNGDAHISGISANNFLICFITGNNIPVDREVYHIRGKCILDAFFRMVEFFGGNNIARIPNSRCVTHFHIPFVKRRAQMPANACALRGGVSSDNRRTNYRRARQFGIYTAVVKDS